MRRVAVATITGALVIGCLVPHHKRHHEDEPAATVTVRPRATVAPVSTPTPTPTVSASAVASTSVRPPAKKGPPPNLPPCPEGYDRCDADNKCTNLKKNPAHCGDCVTDCTFKQMDANAESVFCIQGTCVTKCRSGQGMCSGKCTDLTYDSSNCGACGRQCPSGRACDSGKCMR